MTNPKRKNTGKLKEPVRIRTKKLADGSESLYLDIYHDGKRSYEFLKMYLLPEVNNKVKEQNRTTREAAETIKSQRIIEITNSKAGIKRKTGWQKLKLADWLETFRINQEKKGIRNMTAIKSVIKVIKQYGRKEKTLMGDIDKNWAIGFIEWMKNTYKVNAGDENEKTLSDNSIRSYISLLSNALNSAVRNDMLAENPFNRLSSDERVKKPESTREYLTTNEVKLMIKTDCKNTVVKNAFLFSCFTGLRFSDIIRLTYKDIINNEGNFLLSIVMRKTSKPIYIPLSKNALKWLPERKDKDIDDLVFAEIPFNAETNRVVKEWAKKAGIKKTVTYHISRHTFGTMMLTAGADLYTVSKLMGHAEVRTTQIYAKIIDSKKIEAAKMVDNLFKK